MAAVSSTGLLVLAGLFIGGLSVLNSAAVLGITHIVVRSIWHEAALK